MLFFVDGEVIDRHRQQCGPTEEQSSWNNIANKAVLIQARLLDCVHVDSFPTKILEHQWQWKKDAPLIQHHSRIILSLRTRYVHYCTEDWIPPPESVQLSALRRTPRLWWIVNGSPKESWLDVCRDFAHATMILGGDCFHKVLSLLNALVTKLWAPEHMFTLEFSRK